MASFEQIEGWFHDGLGTHNELCVANALIASLRLNQPSFDLRATNEKMRRALDALRSDPRRATLATEITQIEAASAEVAARISEYLGGRRAMSVSHTPQSFRQGHAADLVVATAGGEDVHFSLKIDKSGRAALAEIGQTPDIYKLFSILFRMTPPDVDGLVWELFGKQRVREVFDRSDNVARILQVALIRVLGLRTGEYEAQPNDLASARPTNLHAVQHLFRMIKRYKSGSDDAIVIVVDRRTGVVSSEFLIDEIDPDQLRLEDIGFTACRPRPGRYRWGTEPCVKYRGRAVFSMQVKHRRGRASGPEFSDITTRVRR